MVFQHPALYPHLSVAGNLAFGLRARRVPRPEVRARVAAVAARLGLEAVLDRAPRTLSGGQRQRVALGRAIVRQPAAFLLDEPLTSLDAPLRAALRAELVELHRSLGTTMIHVTHDQAEALALGQRIAVLNHGRIVQTGTPLEVYHQPRNRFVAQFVGNPPMNVLPCVLERSGSDGQARIRLEGAEGLVSGPMTPPPGLKDRARVDLGIRPEGIAVGPVEEGRSPAVLAAPARVRRLEPLGHETIATLDLGPYPVQIRLTPGASIREGDDVPLRIALERARWFDPKTGESLEEGERSEGFTASVQ
jgi:ABC-type sugar transport system ATPase subunit